MKISSKLNYRFEMPICTGKDEPVATMLTARCRFAIFHLILLNCATTFAAPVTPIVPLLISAEFDEKNTPIPLSNETANLIHYLESTLDLKFELHRYPWKRVMENALNGKGIIYGMSKTPERLRKFSFSESAFIDQTWLITRCDSAFLFTTLQDLKGKTIGVVRGTSSGIEFDQQINILFKIEDDTGATQGRFSKLYYRRMDALTYFWSGTDINKLESELNKQYAKNFTNAEKNEAHVFCVLPKPVSAVSIHFATGIDQDTTVLKMIDKALVRAKNNGDLTRIFSKETQREK